MMSTDNGNTVNGSKLCPKCGFTKPVIHFSMNRSRADGLAQTCRDCHNKYQHDHPTPTTRKRRAVAGERRTRRVVASRDFVDPAFRIASRVEVDRRGECSVGVQVDFGNAIAETEIENHDHGTMGIPHPLPPTTNGDTDT